MHFIPMLIPSIRFTVNMKSRIIGASGSVCFLIKEGCIESGPKLRKTGVKEQILLQGQCILVALMTPQS